MVLSLIVVFCILVLIPVSYTLIQGLRRNIASAQATGLPYVIVPFYITSIPCLLLQPVVFPLLDRLPKKWTEGWLPFLVFGGGWNFGYQPFKTLGVDTLIAVSPTRNVIHTCDPEVSAQIFRRREFKKPVELIELLNVFGPGLTGSEGVNGRLYRRLTAPFFTDQTMEQVWRVAVDSVETLIQGLVESQRSNNSEKSLRSMVASMTLHNVFTVCFLKKSDQKSFHLQEIVPTSHKLGFRQAVLSTLDHIAIIAFTPKFVLKLSPLSIHRKARLLFSELQSYLSNFCESASLNRSRQSSVVKEANLLDLLSQAGLPQPAITGNMFSFLFAGHEANANTLTITLFLLALHPSIQASLQRTIDLHLANCPLQDSSYTTHYHILKESIVVAIINETLRLFTILPFLPKFTPEVPSSIVVKGQTHVMPPNTMILINTSATHRHPAHWPVREGTLHGSAPWPVPSFDPGFWLQSQSGANEFLHPQSGSFIPFSDGSRGCLGRQFAMVELCAQMVAIFSKWSVELVTDERTGWEGARLRAEELLSKWMVFDMTLRPGKMVPIQFVRRDVETG